MTLKSDITIDSAKFELGAVSEKTAELNKQIIKNSALVPKWYDVGAAKYRKMRIDGETLFPKPEPLPQALEINIPSREASRSIPCRLIYPSHRNTSGERKQCKRSVLHIHGGGWVLGDHTSADDILQMYADAGDLAVLSVDYRLAPEHPHPAGPEDCIDIGEYLVKNSKGEYGDPLRFIGGESAGAHLSLIVTFHLLKSQPMFKLSGLLLHYGWYDLTKLPSARNFKQDLILNFASLEKFTDAFLPGVSTEQMKDPSISPYYEDLVPFHGKLPSALFTCGTEDALLDDSICIYTRWRINGGGAIMKIYPGACHGFISFPPVVLGEAEKALDDTKTYIQEHMARLRALEA